MIGIFLLKRAKANFVGGGGGVICDTIDLSQDMVSGYFEINTHVFVIAAVVQ